MSIILNQVVTLACQLGKKMQQAKPECGELYQQMHAGLAALTPGVPVLSEWSKPLLDGSDGWLVALSGLAAEGIDAQATVNIARLEAGVPVLGVVHAPLLGVTYFARQGGASQSTGCGAVAAAFAHFQCARA